MQPDNLPSKTFNLIQFVVLLASTLLFSSPTVAAEKLITQDGREILLKEDGTWEFLSQDRYANTADGRRVRLRPDNTWEYIGNAPLKTEQRVRNELSDFQLQKVVIEAYEEKTHKNKRVVTHTIFYLDIAVSPLAEQPVSLDNATIRVTDNRGKDYPVLAINPPMQKLEPGTRHSVQIRVDGSPQWWSGIKSMLLSISADVIGDQPMEFSYRFNDIDRIEVEALPDI